MLGGLAGQVIKSAVRQAANQLGRQLVRGLLGLGGLLLVWFAWPVMKSAWQAQQADITGMLQRGGEGAAVHIPSHAAQAWQQAVAVVTRINDQQTAIRDRFQHDLFLGANYWKYE